MEQITITHADNTSWPLLTRGAVTAISRAEQRRSLLGEDIVTMTVDSAVILDFRVKDWILIFGYKYFLNTLPKINKKGMRQFSYELIWEGRQYDLLRPKFFDRGVDGISISPDFVLSGDLRFFLGVIINNANTLLGEGKWVLGDCPETQYLTLPFSNENCLAVLQRLCKQDIYNKEFEISENAEGICTITIKDEIGQQLEQLYEYGKGKGLYNLTRTTVSDKNIATRLYVFGSSKNLPSSYRGYSQRLKLPENDLSYLENSDMVDAYGPSEDIVIFENIYPNRTGLISSFTDCTVNQFIDDSIDFDLAAKDVDGNSLYWAGSAPVIHFNSGNLAGYEFEVSAYDHATHKITLKPYTDDRNQQYPDPNLTIFQLALDDKYVILNIIMPESYIISAENDLLTAGQERYIKVCQPRVQYEQVFEELYFKGLYGTQIVNVFGIGDYVPIKDIDINVDKAIRLKSLRRDVIYPYRYTLELSDINETSLTEQLVAANVANSRIITNNNLGEINKGSATSWGEMNSWFVLVNPGLENEYLRCKKALCGDYEIQAFSDSGQIPASWWEAMPLATTTTKGGVILDGVTITMDANGVISAVGGGGTGNNLFDEIYEETSGHGVSIEGIKVYDYGITRQGEGDDLELQVISKGAGNFICGSLSGGMVSIYGSDIQFRSDTIEFIPLVGYNGASAAILGQGPTALQINSWSFTSGNYDGGNLFLSGGNPSGTGKRGGIYLGQTWNDPGLEEKTSETNVVYYDEVTGKLSYGAAGSGGSGEATSLATTNFSITEESGNLVIKYGTTVIARMSSAGLFECADDIETFTTL